MAATHRGRRAKAAEIRQHAIIWLGDAIQRDPELVLFIGADIDKIAERVVAWLEGPARLRIVAQAERKSP